MCFHGPPLLPNLHTTAKCYESPRFTLSKFLERSSWNIGHYLQNPAAALKLIKRTRPDQTPPRPSLGAAASRNADETAPTKN